MLERLATFKMPDRRAVGPLSTERGEKGLMALQPYGTAGLCPVVGHRLVL